MEFYEDHADQRDRFEILAFHDASSKTFEELDEKLAPIEKMKWKGKKLPFPILLDASGDTLKEWGVRAFPTVLLIDPEGKLVKGGSEHMLEKALQEGK
ncbi:MAG: redoxin domain-containing protein [Planctomycetes bacterium]|nr:redoxin domain-containing protein [Planctomycetota bacterium]